MVAKFPTRYPFVFFCFVLVTCLSRHLHTISSIAYYWVLARLTWPSGKLNPQPPCLQGGKPFGSSNWPFGFEVLYILTPLWYIHQRAKNNRIKNNIIWGARDSWESILVHQVVLVMGFAFTTILVGYATCHSQYLANLTICVFNA
jgi:hypothetical protein